MLDTLCSTWTLHQEEWVQQLKVWDKWDKAMGSKRLKAIKYQLLNKP